MSGRKQHFIQRLLLKGFTSDPAAKTPRLWVYCRDGKTFPTSLENYGAERDFYGDLELDAAITEAESKHFSGFLTDARSGADRMVDAEGAATFAVQVFARSRNLRVMVADAIEPMMARADATLRDPEFQVQMIIAGIAQDGRLVEQIYRSGKSLEEFARERVRQRSEEIDRMLETSMAGVRAAISTWQNRTLSERLDFRGSRRDQLASLRWFRVTVSAGNLLLGDSVICAELADGTFKPVTEPGDKLGCVWLPIASNLMLVGTPEETVPAVDAGRVNEGAASCSYDAFCANSGPDVFKDLAGLIRTRTFSLSREQTAKVVNDALRGLV